MLKSVPFEMAAGTTSVDVAAAVASAVQTTGEPTVRELLDRLNTLMSAPYVAPVTGKTVVELFDKMMSLPADKRPSEMAAGATSVDVATAVTSAVQPTGEPTVRELLNRLDALMSAPYVAPVTGKTVVELFDEMMALPADERPSPSPDWVWAIEGEIALFWLPEVSGQTVDTRDNKKHWTRRNVAGVTVVDLHPHLRRRGIFTNLLRHMAEHKEVDHVAVADASTDEIQACLGELIIRGHPFSARGADFTWCAIGGCGPGCQLRP